MMLRLIVALVSVHMVAYLQGSANSKTGPFPPPHGPTFLSQPVPVKFTPSTSPVPELELPISFPCGPPVPTRIMQEASFNITCAISEPDSYVVNGPAPPPYNDDFIFKIEASSPSRVVVSQTVSLRHSFLEIILEQVEPLCVKV